MSGFSRKLKELWRALVQFVTREQKRPRHSGRALDDGQVLSRFLTSTQHYTKSTPKQVKYNAFLPRDGATSVFHTNGLTDDAIRSLGHAHVKVRKIYGRGDITVSTVARQPKLAIDADYEPERHVNILGWPHDLDDQMAIALDLAADATLHLDP